jgi:coenzyme F420-0:L-glutamate ligase
MNARAVKTRVFEEGEDLATFIIKHLPRLKEQSVLAVTSKIVALSESRTAPLGDERTREKLVRGESDWALSTKYAWLTLKDGIFIANAGIDESNAAGKLVLLPKDSFVAAAKLRGKLKKHYGLKELGILITDSRIVPLRAGVTGVALGYAGFKGVKDYRGARDIFGRVMKIEQVNIADLLAASAILVMGEGSEQRPLAVIEGIDIAFSQRVNRKEGLIDVEDDLYYPILRPLFKRTIPKRPSKG